MAAPVACVLPAPRGASPCVTHRCHELCRPPAPRCFSGDFLQLESRRATGLRTAGPEKLLAPNGRWAKEQGLSRGANVPANVRTKVLHPQEGDPAASAPACTTLHIYHFPTACANSAPIGYFVLSPLVPKASPTGFPAVFPSCRPADGTNSAGSGLPCH